jgi:hypothetical protein
MTRQVEWAVHLRRLSRTTLIFIACRLCITAPTVRPILSAIASSAAVPRRASSAAGCYPAVAGEWGSA